MTTRVQLIAEAESWVGTPWQHQGRMKGVACDCVGLLMGIAKNLGLPYQDVNGYPPRPGPELRRIVEEQMVRAGKLNRKPGDALMFAWNRNPLHMGVLVEDGYVIHATGIVGHVVKHRMDDNWLKAIVQAYQFKGLED